MCRAQMNGCCFVRVRLLLLGLVLPALLAGRGEAAPVSLPYGNDFEAPPGSEWSFTPASGAWSVSGGTLNYSSTLTGSTLTAAVQLDNSVNVANTGVRMSMDFRASTIPPGSDIGFGAFGDTPNYVLGGDAHYLADLKPSGAMRILRVSNAMPLSHATLIDLTGLYTFSPEETYTLTFEMFPTAGTNQLRLTIDDPSRGAPLTLSVVDPNLLPGRYMGIRNRNQGAVAATFDDFSLAAIVPPRAVYNFDWGPNNGVGVYSGVAAALDPAGTGAVWSQGYNGGDNAVADSFGNPSTVKVWLESAYGFGTRTTNWDTDTSIGASENTLQGDLFWITQAGLDHEASTGGNGLYDITVKGLDPSKVYDLYVYGGGNRGTTVTLGEETYTMTGTFGNPANPLAWAESRHFVAFRGLSGSSEYALALGVAAGSTSLGFSGLQVVLIPEPSSGLLCLLALSCAVLGRRRRR